MRPRLRHRQRPRPSNSYDEDADPGARELPEFERNDVRRAAMNLLARREYGRAELSARLAGKGMPESLVAEVLDELAAEGLQSDIRFAEAFVQARAGRGQGPVRIRMELERRGVSSGTLENALEDCEIDWPALAGTVRRKRFGGSRPGDFRERARQMRFLQYRGFTADHIRAAVGDDD
jgi:regulatory protein